MAEVCANCRFWDVYEKTSERVGDCRRHAPRLSDEMLRAHMPSRSMVWEDLPDFVYPASAFPMSHEDSWCGEYESRKDGGW